ncbi:hypothetical protein C8R43DRAFT_354816 [Mycena crocata]|nr:hypothetical protein C8R43DRAFT_354816 [Mycena crocata]
MEVTAAISGWLIIAEILAEPYFWPKIFDLRVRNARFWHMPADPHQLGPTIYFSLPTRSPCSFSGRRRLVWEVQIQGVEVNLALGGSPRGSQASARPKLWAFPKTISKGRPTHLFFIPTTTHFSPTFFLSLPLAYPSFMHDAHGASACRWHSGCCASSPPSLSRHSTHRRRQLWPRRRPDLQTFKIDPIHY